MIHRQRPLFSAHNHSRVSVDKYFDQIHERRPASLKLWIVDIIRRGTLEIARENVTVQRRKFHCLRSEATKRIEQIGFTFLEGYHEALASSSVMALGEHIEQTVIAQNRGFAFEGAAMALMLLDQLGLSRRSFSDFLYGPGARHAYMVHVGAGWALARLPWARWRLRHAVSKLDPLLRWLSVDGFGFHEGYFNWPVTLGRHAMPRSIGGYARRAFDQGLGRSIWFVEGTDPDQVGTSISGFPAPRQRDLWSGVGLACAYAGGAGPTELLRIKKLAGEHMPAVAQGAAFAAEARDRADNPVEHCELACRYLCDLSAKAAASLTQEAKKTLPCDEAIPAYEIWRTRVQARLSRAGKEVL